MYFPDSGCVHTLLTLYDYATATLAEGLSREESGLRQDNSGPAAED